MAAVVPAVEAEAAVGGAAVAVASSREWRMVRMQAYCQMICPEGQGGWMTVRFHAGR